MSDEESALADLDLDDRTATGIAAAVSRRIRSGAVQPGDRLPTVRDVARDLRVSPATVNQAWRALAAAGVIVSRGRAGTFAVQPEASAGTRYWRLHPPASDAFAVDLSRGTPDPSLLPDLSSALRTVAGADLASNYLGDAVLPELEERMRASWPFDPDRIAVMDGALDAVDRIISAHVRLGDRVVVEDPCFPPFLDLLTRVGARAVPVGLDSSGMLPAELAAAIASHRPVLVILQTRAQNPTGASLTPERVRELAAVVGDVVVLEDDHSGDIARSPDLSLGKLLADNVVHVRSYSKSHGADLRLSVVGGSSLLLDQVIDRRMLGPGWTSRLLQRLLVAMLDDPAAAAVVNDARKQYRLRGELLRSALRARGLDVVGGDGVNMWIPVRDENAALVTLAASGIKAAPGSVFRVAETDDAYLRITVAGLPTSDIDRVAIELAHAATVEPHYGRRR